MPTPTAQLPEAAPDDVSELLETPFTTSLLELPADVYGPESVVDVRMNE